MPRAVLTWLIIASLSLAACGSSTESSWEGGDEPYEVEEDDSTTARDLGTALQRYGVDTEIDEFDVCLRLQLTDSEESQQGDRVGVDMPDGWTFSAMLYEGECPGSLSNDSLIGAIESAEGSVDFLEDDDGGLDGFVVDVDVIFDHERDDLPTRYLIAFDDVALR